MPKRKDEVVSGSALIQEIRSKMSESEWRQHEVLDRKTSRMWRNFWIEAAHRRGYSNVEIAQQFEMSESTVRSVLSK